MTFDFDMTECMHYVGGSSNVIRQRAAYLLPEPATSQTHRCLKHFIAPQLLFFQGNYELKKHCFLLPVRDILRKKGNQAKTDRIIDIIDIKDIMDIIDIMDLIDLMDLIDIMDLIGIMDLVDILDR